MIRVMRGGEVPGIKDSPARWHWSVAGYGLSGISRQPLSDACRKLLACGVDPETPVGRYREGHDIPDLTSTVGAAASATVKDADKGRIRFARFVAFDRAAIDHEASPQREAA